jgi:hypothetical protein
MMLRSLVDEVVRRRLMPVVIVALLVIVAAPLLFMKSAPAGAPAASSSPAAATPGKLPARAEKLLVTNDKAVTPRHRVKGSGKDPFAPPASAEQQADGTTAATPAAAAPAAGSSAGPGAKALTGEARKVTIANPDGSTTTISTNKKSKKKAKKKAAAKKKATKQTPAPQTSPVRNVALVNVRYGARMGAREHRVPRLQTFKAAGTVVAMFVKYSPARHKAVFAIAPSTVVKGDVKCRRKEGVCRYVDIPAGKHVRLYTRTARGTLVSRRLDVVSIERVPATAAAVTAPAPAPRTTPLSQATCLLKSLLALPSVILPSISVAACD